MNDIAFMKRLYQVKGIKSAFDAYALHPYGATVSVMKRQIINTRALMKTIGGRSNAPLGRRVRLGLRA